MAITRAKQVRQMLKNGKVAMQGGVKNYLGKKKTVTVPKDWQSSPDHPTTQLAYITKAEKDLLLKKDLHNSLNGKPNRGPSGVMSLNGWGDKGDNSDRSFGGGERYDGGNNNPNQGGSGTGGDNSNKDYNPKKGTKEYNETIKNIQKAKREEEARQKAAEKAKSDAKKAAEKALADKRAREFKEAQEKDEENRAKARAAAAETRKRNQAVYARNLRVGQKNKFNLPDSFYDQEEEKDDFLSGAYDDLFENQYDSGGFKGPLLTVLDPLFKKGAKYSRNYFTDNVLGKGGYKNITPEDFANMTLTQRNEIYDGYMGGRQSGETDAYGNVNPDFGKGDGGDNYVPPIAVTDPADPADPVDPRDYSGLGARFLGSQFDFSGLADGGIARAGYMDGGMPEYQGGIMDLESGRQQYFLGKLVKKATRAVKKIAKSPFGKAALLYFGGNALMSGGAGKGLSSFFGKGSFNPLRMAARATADGPLTQLSPFGKILSKVGLTSGVDGGSLTKLGKFGLSAGIPAGLALLASSKEEEDQPLDLGPGINVADIRANPYKYLAPRFTGSQFAADGGRIGYAEGSKEPVAKETMPLLDMDGQEMDLRAEGGFVPLGRMERADDVPARLSKNEFVFTADAVRNAGEGDIDKGAEVMYNMMKNLESGGEVSEESQGLDGAREMFQTSQRLEEVL